MTDTVVPMNMSERAKTPRFLRLHGDDNLVVALDPILPGAVAEGVTAISRVPKGHKMATRAIGDGEPVRLAYAAKSCHEYTSIGKVLIDRGAIPREEVSMQTIRAWMEANPA